MHFAPTITRHKWSDQNAMVRPMSIPIVSIPVGEATLVGQVGQHLLACLRTCRHGHRSIYTFSNQCINYSYKYNLGQSKERKGWSGLPLALICPLFRKLSQVCNIFHCRRVTLLGCLDCLMSTKCLKILSSSVVMEKGSSTKPCYSYICGLKFRDGVKSHSM